MTKKKEKKTINNLTLIDFVIPGYDWEEIKEVLTPDQYDKFCNFMSGQTMGLHKDGREIVYSYDFDRFVRNILHIYHAE